jgi:hypothetical protein
MSYPSSILSITNPLSSNTLNSPDHAQQHTLVNNDLIAVESVLGVQNSLDPNSITYQVQNPASQGGGHIQGASYGGTGQTYYNKGDILVGVSASVVGRQAAGPQGYAVVYDSTQTNGLNSSAILSAPVIQNQVYTYAQGSVLSASVYGVQITPTPSLLQGTSFDIKWPRTNTSSIVALSISSLISVLVKNPDGTNPAVGAIKASVIGTVKFDAVSSVFQYSNSPDAENLVGKLPAIDGSQLTNISVTTIQTNKIAATAISAGQALSSYYSSSDGGVTLDANTTFHTYAAASSTTSFSVGSNSNRMLVVNFVTAGTISGVTYNGVSMTQLTTQALTTSSTTQYCYYLIAPTTGANNLIISSSGTPDFMGTISSYYNVAQTSPEANAKAVSTGDIGQSITTIANGALTVALLAAAGFSTGSFISVNNSPYNGTGQDGGNAYSSHVFTSDSGKVYPAAQTWTQTIISNLSNTSGHEGIIIVSFAPFTVPTTGAVTPATASTIGYGQNLFASFEGFAASSTSVLGIVPVIVAGEIPNLSLIPSLQYYLSNTLGAISSVAGQNTRKVGISTSSTNLLVTNIW